MTTNCQITNEEYFEKVAEGNLDKVKEFFATGGNIYAVDEMLMTGLQISCFYGHKEIVNYLLFEKNFFKDTKETFQKNCGGESLNMACSGGHLDIVQILIEKIGVDVNNSGFLLPTDPPIVHARFSIFFVIFSSLGGKLEVVKYLLKQGASIDRRNDSKYQYGKNSKMGPNALIASCLHGHLELMKFLLENGADPNVVLNANESIFQYCTKLKKMEELKLLKDFGVKEEKEINKSEINLKKFETLDEALASGPSDHVQGKISKD
jgi:ankyrin repeat protein